MKSWSKMSQNYLADNWEQMEVNFVHRWSKLFLSLSSICFPSVTSFVKWFANNFTSDNTDSFIFVCYRSAQWYYWLSGSELLLLIHQNTEMHGLICCRWCAGMVNNAEDGPSLQRVQRRLMTMIWGWLG